jgi:hypothetical protein
MAVGKLYRKIGPLKIPWMRKSFVMFFLLLQSNSGHVSERQKEVVAEKNDIKHNCGKIGYTILLNYDRPGRWLF